MNLIKNKKLLLQKKNICMNFIKNMIGIIIQKNLKILFSNEY